MSDGNRLPRFSPAGLSRAREPFDHPDFLYELKYDGWRALAYIQPDQCELVSRRGNTFKSFAPLRASLATIGHEVILDGEIVCLDASGKPQFYDLMRQRGEPVFYAFDVLWLDGADLRSQPAIERKRILENLVRDRPRILYASHFEARGVDVFRLVCEQDLEGIVCKHRSAAYGIEGAWIKVLNPTYSQRDGRRDMFEKTGTRRAPTA